MNAVTHGELYHFANLTTPCGETSPLVLRGRVPCSIFFSPHGDLVVPLSGLPDSEEPLRDPDEIAAHVVGAYERAGWIIEWV